MHGEDDKDKGDRKGTAWRGLFHRDGLGPLPMEARFTRHADNDSLLTWECGRPRANAACLQVGIGAMRSVHLNLNPLLPDPSSQRDIQAVKGQRVSHLQCVGHSSQFLMVTFLSQHGI